MKFCKKCRTWKERDDYYRRGSSKDGLPAPDWVVVPPVSNEALENEESA